MRVAYFDEPLPSSSLQTLQEEENNTDDEESGDVAWKVVTNRRRKFREPNSQEGCIVQNVTCQEDRSVHPVSSVIPGMRYSTPGDSANPASEKARHGQRTRGERSGNRGTRMSRNYRRKNTGTTNLESSHRAEVDGKTIDCDDKTEAIWPSQTCSHSSCAVSSTATCGNLNPLAQLTRKHLDLLEAELEMMTSRNLPLPDCRCSCEECTYQNCVPPHEFVEALRGNMNLECDICTTTLDPTGVFILRSSILQQQTQAHTQQPVPPMQPDTEPHNPGHTHANPLLPTHEPVTASTESQMSPVRRPSGSSPRHANPLSFTCTSNTNSLTHLSSLPVDDSSPSVSVACSVCTYSNEIPDFVFSLQDLHLFCEVCGERLDLSVLTVTNPYKQPNGNLSMSTTGQPPGLSSTASSFCCSVSAPALIASGTSSAVTTHHRSYLVGDSCVTADRGLPSPSCEMEETIDCPVCTFSNTKANSARKHWVAVVRAQTATFNLCAMCGHELPFSHPSTTVPPSPVSLATDKTCPNSHCDRRRESETVQGVNPSNSLEVLPGGKGLERGYPLSLVAPQRSGMSTNRLPVGTSNIRSVPLVAVATIQRTTNPTTCRGQRKEQLRATGNSRRSSHEGLSLENNPLVDQALPHIYPPTVSSFTPEPDASSPCSSHIAALMSVVPPPPPKHLVPPKSPYFSLPHDAAVAHDVDSNSEKGLNDDASSYTIFSANSPNPSVVNPYDSRIIIQETPQPAAAPHMLGVELLSLPETKIPAASSHRLDNQLAVSITHKTRDDSPSSSSSDSSFFGSPRGSPSSKAQDTKDILTIHPGRQRRAFHPSIGEAERTEDRGDHGRRLADMEDDRDEGEDLVPGLSGQVRMGESGTGCAGRDCGGDWAAVSVEGGRYRQVDDEEENLFSGGCGGEGGDTWTGMVAKRDIRDVEIVGEVGDRIGEGRYEREGAFESSRKSALPESTVRGCRNMATVERETRGREWLDDETREGRMCGRARQGGGDTEGRLSSRGGILGEEECEEERKCAAVHSEAVSSLRLVRRTFPTVESSLVHGGPETVLRGRDFRSDEESASLASNDLPFCSPASAGSPHKPVRPRDTCTVVTNTRRDNSPMTCYDKRGDNLSCLGNRRSSPRGDCSDAVSRGDSSLRRPDDDYYHSTNRVGEARRKGGDSGEKGRGREIGNSGTEGPWREGRSYERVGNCWSISTTRTGVGGRDDKFSLPGDPPASCNKEIKMIQSMRVMVLMGLPASGKSSLSRELRGCVPGVIVCSQDEMGSRPKVAAAMSRALTEMPSRRCVVSRVIVDRCNVESWERRLWMDVAQDARVPSSQVGLVFLDVPSNLCRSRIVKRTGHPTVKSGQCEAGYIRVDRDTRNVAVARMLCDW
eukprot:GHVQ01025088.1.p1 GENE.GHVQ01025088.1~~GHVQ01025088.1.p1  ORF type:complete len:1378 (-),score=235.46 GHVQ01025088.1:1013-5146(-)